MTEAGNDNYAGPFDSDFALHHLSRTALARLGREYMLFGHIRDRALMPPVGLRYGPQATEDLSILEWMGASPLYTQRMRRAMGIDGDGVSAIFKMLQLDVGFPHRYMDVGYEQENESVGYFWLNSCGALRDVEPFGESQVHSMCHSIEDPTFDATAFATNPHARVRPVHRPPRRPADRVPHCRWMVAIDTDNPAVPEPAITRTARETVLTDMELLGPLVDDGPGADNYTAAFDPAFGLDQLSRRALVTVCKEFLIQNQLLARSAALGLIQAYGEEVCQRMLAAQWRGLAPLSTRRVCRALGIERSDVCAVVKMLQVHPVFAHDYLRLEFEVVDTHRARFRVNDCPALIDVQPRGLLDLLFSGHCGGLDAMVRALDPRARCLWKPHPDGHPAWEIRMDRSSAVVGEPEEAAFVAACTVTGADLETPTGGPTGSGGA